MSILDLIAPTRRVSEGFERNSIRAGTPSCRETSILITYIDASWHSARKPLANASGWCGNIYLTLGLCFALTGCVQVTKNSSDKAVATKKVGVDGFNLGETEQPPPSADA